MISIQEQIYQAIPASFVAGLGAVAMRDRFKESITEMDWETMKDAGKTALKTAGKFWGGDGEGGKAVKQGLSTAKKYWTDGGEGNKTVKQGLSTAKKYWTDGDGGKKVKAGLSAAGDKIRSAVGSDSKNDDVVQNFKRASKMSINNQIGSDIKPIGKKLMRGIKF